MTTPLVEAISVSKTFVAKEDFLGRAVETVRAITDVSLTIREGETLGLVGESGCGKSTLGRLLIRLLDPSSGRLLLGGRDITTARGADLEGLRRTAQIVFQDPKSSLDPRLSIGDILREPFVIHGIARKGQIPGKVRELLEQVGLPPDFAERLPHELSGGQRQRVGIARALAVSPRLVVLDEPVSALDVSVQAQALNLLRDLQVERNLAYLFIAHDLDVVSFMSHRVAVMYLGRIVEVLEGSGLRGRARHPYTLALREAVPVPAPGRARRKLVLAGDIPSPIAPPPGCAFHTRCPFSKPGVCDTAVPVLEPVAEGHLVACHRVHEIDVRQTSEAPAVHEIG